MIRRSEKKTVTCGVCAKQFECNARSARFYCGPKCARLGTVARRDMMYSSQASAARYAALVAMKKRKP